MIIGKQLAPVSLASNQKLEAAWNGLEKKLAWWYLANTSGCELRVPFSCSLLCLPAHSEHLQPQ